MSFKFGKHLVFSALVLGASSCSLFSSSNEDEEGNGLDMMSEDINSGLSDGGNIPGGMGSSEIADVTFGYDSYELSADSRAILDDGVTWIQNNNPSKVVAEGHTDSRGTDEYNMALGQRRATAVADYLSTKGISSSVLSTVSYGEDVPATEGTSESEMAQNRRVHFAITK